MHTDWQDVVRLHGPRLLDYRDPKSHGLTEEKEYTKWDLDNLTESDIVFAYLESENPSGAGLALEIGYAYAQRKYIIFVCRRDHPYYSNFGMARSCANKVFHTLEDGVQYLRTFKNIRAEVPWRVSDERK